jgi:O-antigen/teichoic acid export membrane protein
MLAQKSIFTLFADVSNALLSYVALFFITKYMSPAAYGIIGFATGYVSLMFILGDLGFDSAHVKYISSGEEQSKCTGVHLTVKAVLTVVGAATVISSVLIWKYVLGRGFESPDHEIAIYIILLSIMLKGFATPFQTTFMAEKEMAKNRATQLVGTVIRLVAIIYVALAGLGVMALAFAYVVEAIGILSVSCFIFLRKYTITRPEVYSSFWATMRIV